jgi:hypothetical protein
LGTDCILHNLGCLEPDEEDLTSADYVQALSAVEHYHAFIRAMTFPFVPKRGLKEGVTHHQIHVPEYDGEDWSHLLPPITDSLREQRDEDEIPMLLVHDEQRRAEFRRLIGPPKPDLWDRLFCQFQGGLSLTTAVVATAELSNDGNAVVEYCFRRMIRDYLDYIPTPVMAAARELL